MIADAVRRIGSALKLRPDIKARERVMVVHLAIFGLYLLLILFSLIVWLLAVFGKAKILLFNFSLAVTQIFNTMTELLIIHVTY